VIEPNHVGEIGIELRQPFAADTHAADPTSGRIVLELGGRVAGGGLVAPGEPERAGRWWWEEQERKECGLHARPA
jgi:3'-phosphoadenosine 5'-phosphosulfate sulfotransferase (PAPS reductase)/FAD synthetase